MCKITGWPKKLAYIVLDTLTSSNIDRLSNLFHCQNQENICNNTLTKDLTTPVVWCYITLWNVNVLKATIENKTTSVTTHFKSASSSSKADIEHVKTQLLWIITDTINALFPVVNLLKYVVTEVLFLIVAFKTLTFHKVV